MIELAVLIGLAAYRGARLLAHDTILADVRHRFFRRFPPNTLYRRHARIVDAKGKKGRWTVSDKPVRKASWLGRLVECPWCSSVWLAAAIVAGTTWYRSVPCPWLVWGAACSVAGLCATLDAVRGS